MINRNRNKEDKDNEQNKSLLIFLNDLKERKDRIRNLLLHGKIEEFIKDTELQHKALNVFTLKYEDIQLNYDEAIHGNKKGKIKQEKVNILAQDTLILLSSAIIKFNEHIDLKKLEG